VGGGGGKLAVLLLEAPLSSCGGNAGIVLSVLLFSLSHFVIAVPVILLGRHGSGGTLAPWLASKTAGGGGNSYDIGGGAGSGGGGNSFFTINAGGGGGGGGGGGISPHGGGAGRAGGGSGLSHVGISGILGVSFMCCAGHSPTSAIGGDVLGQVDGSFFELFAFS